MPTPTKYMGGTLIFPKLTLDVVDTLASLGT